MGALKDNTEPGTRQEAIIAAVLPGNAARGKTHSITIELARDNARRDGLPADKPDWVQIGPFEAQAIARKGNIVTVEIKIPADASVGVLFDCHLEFGRGARPIVVKKNDVFRVVD
jgi:hypothetical protein